MKRMMQSAATAGPIAWMTVAAAEAQGVRGEGYHDHMWAGGHSAGHGFLWLGLAIIFWIAVVVLAGVALRWLIGSGVLGVERNDAMRILKERFARGEIDAEEFSQRRKALED